MAQHPLHMAGTIYCTWLETQKKTSHIRTLQVMYLAVEESFTLCSAEPSQEDLLHFFELLQIFVIFSWATKLSY